MLSSLWGMDVNEALNELFTKVETEVCPVTITGSEYARCSSEIVERLKSCIEDAGDRINQDGAELVVSATESALMMMSLFIFGERK